MAWQEDMTEVLRALVNDLDTTQRYSDEKLERVLVVSAFQVLASGLVFSQTFKVSISNATIIPDPSVEATKDISFMNLVTLKAACILDHGSAIVAAGRAIAVRDGGSSVDLRGVFGAQLKLIEKGWCVVYDDAVLNYQSGQGGVAGAAVLTPFRLYSQGGWGVYDEREIFH